MKTFKQLLNESYEGKFTLEFNNNIEIHVDYGKAQIVIEKFRTKNELTPYYKEKYSSLYGMFGKPTVEEKFNEIINNL